MEAKIARYVDVAVPLPIRTPLTYRLPEGLSGCSRPGSRALVPVGRRLLTGVIVEAAGALRPPDAAVKEVAELPDEAPVLPPELLELALWAARYYVAPPGSMVAAALPPGIGRRSEVVVRRGPRHPGG
ncbi:MAG TPA: primosomal protein N', partial [Candidatus Polarisedimenticolia bacterium]|nr:primosomal protein N' [Candidatus Polarisedimenticolia bacterium]